MAIREIECIRKEAIFGRKLFMLGAEDGLLGPAAVAEALYKKDDCYNLVKPRGREAKYAVNKKKDIEAIARRVQEHFDKENVCDVQSNYIMAYGILFNCSYDFLYGKIEERCPNASVNDICKKTGLSSLAVFRLMNKEEICIEDYLDTVNQYGLLDSFPEEENDEFYETFFSIPEFWSKLIESDLYTDAPEDWYRMACALYTDRAVKLVAKDAKETWDEVPAWDEFEAWIETWESFHPDSPIYIPRGMTFEEAYRKDKEWVKNTYREIRYKHLYSSIDMTGNTEMIYWGCAGKFDRCLQQYFHKMADDWCKNGPLPRREIEPENESTK